MIVAQGIFGDGGLTSPLPFDITFSSDTTSQRIMRSVSNTICSTLFNTFSVIG